jgi:hypothetical protein
MNRFNTNNDRKIAFDFVNAVVYFKKIAIIAHFYVCDKARCKPIALYEIMAIVLNYIAP